MDKNISVSLGIYFENFIDNKISQGRYKNASEIIKAGLHLLKEEENNVSLLKSVIQEGLDSDIAKNFDP